MSSPSIDRVLDRERWREGAQLSGPWQSSQKAPSGLRISVLRLHDRVHVCAGGVSIGKFIIPYPHIRQVLVPEEGCRLILGTDGLWDFLAPSRVFSLVGHMAPAAAAAALCKQAHIAQVRMPPMQ